MLVTRFVPVLAAIVMFASGCGGGSSSTAAPDTDSSSASGDAGAGATSLPPIAVCPTPTPDGSTFPAGTPAQLPHPDFATGAATEPADVKGVELLKFSTAMSLRDAVIFVTKEYPQAGWVIGDGDAEGHEADVPFSRGAVTGKLRLTGVAPCLTTWLVTTSSGTSATP